MTAAITPASTIAASPAPAGPRQSPQGSGFGQMLDAAGPRHTDAQTEAQARFRLATQHEARHHQPRDEAGAPAGADPRQAAGGVAKAVAHGAGSLEDADDAGLDSSDAEHDKLDSEDNEELPSQIKAEQAISALMNGYLLVAITGTL